VADHGRREGQAGLPQGESRSAMTSPLHPCALKPVRAAPRCVAALALVVATTTTHLAALLSTCRALAPALAAPCMPCRF
jgi:hypothetical protein